jgi:hypothetical protein
MMACGMFPVPVIPRVLVELENIYIRDKKFRRVLWNSKKGMRIFHVEYYLQITPSKTTATKKDNFIFKNNYLLIF